MLRHVVRVRVHYLRERKAEIIQRGVRCVRIELAEEEVRPADIEWLLQ